VLAVAGRNARLEATLRAAAVQRPRIRAFGYTDRVPELMAAADLVITSPGDTCAEARAVGRRLLLLDVLPGHGQDNCQHQLEPGNAWVTSAGRDDVVRTALAALAAPEPAPGSAAPDGTTRPARVLRDWEAAFSAVLAELGFGPPPPAPWPPAPGRPPLAARFAACVLPAGPPTY
jgi:processive 1,2-diacylglycerol beta-glucosyltransferase